VRTEQFAKDPAQTRLIAGYEQVAAPLINRVVGSITETISRDANPAGASPMGELVADAQLAATAAPDQGGAQIAFMNTGGVRQALTFRPGGAVSYGDVFSAQPFSNNLVTMTLSGAQIHRVLESQWRSANGRPIYLYVSRGFSYSWDASKPPGSRVAPESIKLNGQVLDPHADYRVTVNAFVAAGGDGFRIFTEGKAPLVGIVDSDALALYLQAHPGLKPSPLDRVKRLN
jgi:5'-nucleotidase